MGDELEDDPDAVLAVPWVMGTDTMEEALVRVREYTLARDAAPDAALADRARRQ